MVQADPNTKIEIVRMCNLATFNIMGELTFGDSLNVFTGIENSDWGLFIFCNSPIGGLLPRTYVLLRALIPNRWSRKRLRAMTSARSVSINGLSMN